jgi:hypothetical protein
VVALEVRQGMTPGPGIPTLVAEAEEEEVPVEAFVVPLAALELLF